MSQELSTVLLAASRDASVVNMPNTRSPKKVHVAVDVQPVGKSYLTGQMEYAGEAACDPGRMPLDMSVAGPAAEVPASRRCRRRGCAARWPELTPATVR